MPHAPYGRGLRTRQETSLGLVVGSIERFRTILREFKELGSEAENTVRVVSLDRPAIASSNFLPASVWGNAK